MTAQNAADLREEWVSRCGRGRELTGASIGIQSAYPELNGALGAIFRAHGATVSEDAPQYIVALDTVPISLSAAEKVLAVYTGEDVHHQDGWMVLRTPAFYGAGLPDGCGINEAILDNSSLRAIHCTLLFQAMIRALSHFQPGITEVSSDDPDRDTELRTLRLLKKYPQRRFYDDTSYGGQLRQLQLRQLECLLELDRICKEHKIQYFLGGGTLLGAVRHQGFIPWDDDIDVMMTRENFDRFAKIAPKAVSDAFFYQDSLTDPDYHSPFTKIRLNGTKFTTAFSSRFSNMHNGVFLDIFAHDAAPKQEKMLKLHIFITRFARSMVFHKWAGTPIHFYGRLKWLCRIMDAVKNLCSMQQLECFQKFVMTFWNHRNTGWMYDGMGEHLDHGRFPAALLDEAVDAEFEGHHFPIPKRYDEYLRFSYGADYLSWPRPAQRNSHHAAVEFSLSSDGTESIQEDLRPHVYTEKGDLEADP